VCKDPRLHQLATTIRGAMRHDFGNGQMKSLSSQVVCLLRSHCLCTDHNLRINVYVCLHTVLCMM